MRRAASESCAQALGLRFLRDALPQDLSCAGLGERAAKQWRLDLVDSSVNRALAALEERGTPADFPRGGCGMPFTIWPLWGGLVIC